MHFLAMYYKSDVKLYCAWNSFLELGQVHYKSNLIVLLVSFFAKHIIVGHLFRNLQLFINMYFCTIFSTVLHHSCTFCIVVLRSAFYLTTETRVEANS